MAEGEGAVLVVEDEEDICWALTRILRGMGYNVVSIQNGEDALGRIEGGSFRVGFIDAKLPDMEGIALAQKIKTLQADLPLVLVSGYFYDDDRKVRGSIANGLFCEFVSKPFGRTEIQNAVQVALAAGQ